MNNTNNTTTLNVSNLMEQSTIYETNKHTVKSIVANNKTIIKDVLNMMLKELKDINQDDKFITYSKKSKLSIITVKLDADLHTDFKRAIKAVSIYLLSKSSLDFSTLSNNKFITGMTLINNGTVTKFKDNNALLTLIKSIEDNKLIERANKLSDI